MKQLLLLGILALAAGCGAAPDTGERPLKKESFDEPMGYTCASCGEVHHELPDFGTEYPDHYWDVPEAERSERVRLTGDTCVIDDEYYFIRGVIEIPIHDHPENFGFGVWVSQKKENFEAYVANPDTEEIGPFFGWLCTRLDYYEEDTQLLKTNAHFRSGGLRPRIELQPTDHPLAKAQLEGITLDEAWKIAHHYMAKD